MRSDFTLNNNYPTAAVTIVEGVSARSLCYTRTNIRDSTRNIPTKNNDELEKQMFLFHCLRKLSNSTAERSLGRCLIFYTQLTGSWGQFTKHTTAQVSER